MSDRGPESVLATEMVKAHTKEKDNNSKKNPLYILGLSSDVAT